MEKVFRRVKKKNFPISHLIRYNDAELSNVKRTQFFLFLSLFYFLFRVSNFLAWIIKRDERGNCVGFLFFIVKKKEEKVTFNCLEFCFESFLLNSRSNSIIRRFFRLFWLEDESVKIGKISQHDEEEKKVAEELTKNFSWINWLSFEYFFFVISHIKASIKLKNSYHKHDETLSTQWRTKNLWIFKHSHTSH